jgi:hypothetical protein
MLVAILVAILAYLDMLEVNIEPPGAKQALQKQ